MTTPENSKYYQSQADQAERLDRIKPDFVGLDQIKPAFGWLELVEVGNYQEALACIEEHLRMAPEDAQALNDAGAILHCLGRSDEAINYLLQARKLSAGADAEIVWNLVEAYIADGRPSEATQLFDEMERMGILNADVLNRTANIFLNQDDKANAIETLLRSLQVAEQEILRPMIDVIRSKRPKIAFFCGSSGEDESLIQIYDFTQQRFPAQLLEGRSIDEMYNLMKWSDICWFDGCTDAVVEASKQPKVCKNIVRLHGFDSHNDSVSHIQWENIDVLITVGSSSVQDALVKQVPDIKDRTWPVAIPNAVDLNKFRFIDRGRGKNLACVGNLNIRNNPVLLLQCMQKLHYIDPEYRLFFAGTFQNPALEQYARHMIEALGLTDVAFFDGRQHDVNSWLQDKHHIVSGSIGESLDMGLLEGMACGLKPVIHNFPGASQIFPTEFLFNIAEEFCEQILCDRYEPEKYHRFVEQNYPLKNQLNKINSILTQLEAENTARASRPLTGLMSWE